MVLKVFEKGGFENVIRLFQKLENGPYLVTLQRVAMRKSEQEIGGNQLINAVDANMLVEVMVK